MRAGHEPIADRPLSALLSQVLVAFTVEFDNEFERRMTQAAYPEARLSLVVWSNLMRFIGESGVAVRDLAAQALAPEKAIMSELGCLERWKFVTLRPDPSDGRPIPVRAHGQAGRILRDGWGSGRGIRSNWMVRLTESGRKASEIWLPLFGEIEQRWRARFGEDPIGSLRQSLEAVVAKLDVELPHGLPPHAEFRESYPNRDPASVSHLTLPALLSQLLLTFAIEFDRQSPTPLTLCANTLRVLGEQPIPVADITHLTGASPETSGIGWQLKPYIVLEPKPAASRGKLVRLTPRGLKAQKAYRELAGQIETQWEARFGKAALRRLRESLLELFVLSDEDRLLLSKGLTPPEGTARAGDQAPALGRRDVGSAARQRMRNLVAQTEMFQRDPAGALPWFPLWDMNRGFGP